MSNKNSIVIIMNRSPIFLTFILIVLTSTQLANANFFQNLDLFQRQNATSNISYGSHALQKLDLYLPKTNSVESLEHDRAPILLLVHGGAWMFGDKSHKRLIQNKTTYWNERGWLVVSVNYRLVPEVTVQQQTQDIADALSFVQKNAPRWKADAQRVVIMGYSAGAHLVTLLSTQPEWITTFPQPWKATIALDSAAYDLEAIMSNQHARLYDHAFGTSVEYWRLVSPQAQLKQKLPAFLAVCSTVRADQPCLEAYTFTQQAKALGTTTAFLQIPLSHAEINRDLGKNNDYTQQVDQFMQQQIKD